jgi:hypothetical protein
MQPELAEHHLGKPVRAGSSTGDRLMVRKHGGRK